MFEELKLMFEELKLMFEEFQGGFGVVNKDMLLL